MPGIQVNIFLKRQSFNSSKALAGGKIISCLPFRNAVSPAADHGGKFFLMNPIKQTKISYLSPAVLLYEFEVSILIKFWVLVQQINAQSLLLNQFLDADIVFPQRLCYAVFP